MTGAVWTFVLAGDVSAAGIRDGKIYFRTHFGGLVARSSAMIREPTGKNPSEPKKAGVRSAEYVPSRAPVCGSTTAFPTSQVRV